MKKYIVNIDVDEDAIREATGDDETNLEALIKVVLGWSEGIHPRGIKEQTD